MTTRMSIAKVLRKAVERADRLQVAMHGSIIEELEDYTRRVGVVRLSDDQLEIVLTAILNDAITLVQQEPDVHPTVNAGAIRVALDKRCDTPWKACSGAAASILEEHGIHLGDAKSAQPDTVGEFLALAGLAEAALEDSEEAVDLRDLDEETGEM